MLSESLLLGFRVSGWLCGDFRDADLRHVDSGFSELAKRFSRLQTELDDGAWLSAGESDRGIPGAHALNISITQYATDVLGLTS